MSINAVLSVDQTQAVARAIYQVLASLQPNTELLFYRDDDAPPKMEVHYPDGTTELVGLPDQDESVQLFATPAEAGSHAAWRAVDCGLPEVLTDVLLLQVLENLSSEEGNTLIRIGFMRLDGTFVATYASSNHGNDELLETVTHWAPLPAEPVEVLP